MLILTSETFIIFIFKFMWLFNRFFNPPLLLLSLILCTTSAMSSELRIKGYIVSFNEDEQSERWAEYLFNHLSKRTSDKSIVILQKGAESKNIKRDYKTLHIEVSSDLKYDYCIENTAFRLNVRTRNDQVTVWMVYQIIGSISIEDKRFNTEDLSPPMINLSDSCKSFDFDYREPHFAPNLQTDFAPIHGTNNVETDWGIWGHNLSKVLKAEQDENLYALVADKRTKEQLCFSTPHLLERLSYYIKDNFGEGDKKATMFMINPQDNNLVCTCSDCKANGNTKDNATPAVTYFIRMLSQRFPNHRFYMTAYRTTATPPEHELPESAGVFFSTINLPKGIALNVKQPKTNQFLKQLEAWRSKTPNVYLWDYDTNFDDYLTPIPILYGLQQQLQFFKKRGVKGVFLNGSGYDYSSFDDVQTYVIAAIMMDTQADVAKLCRDFFNKEYPVSGHLLANYYLSLEQNYLDKNKAYNMYGGIRDNLNTYLNVEKFITFYDALETLVPIIKGEEWNKLLKLYTALSYTRLQIAYATNTGEWGYADKEGDKMTVRKEITGYLKQLEGCVAYSDMNNYNESGNTLSDYISEWKRIIAQEGFKNKLLDVEVQIISKPDEGFESSSLLNDGTSGFVQDYHQGWYLSSKDDLHVQFSSVKLKNANTIRLRFLNTPKHGILSPEKIELLGDGKLLKTISSKQMKHLGYTALCDIDIDFSKIKNVELRIIRKDAKKSIIACDEIQILEL